MAPGVHNVSTTAPSWLAIRQLEDLLSENARFWSKVAVGPLSSCWLWRASVTDKGYGQIWWAPLRRPEGSHRVAWMLTRGPIPRGQEVMHSCDVPKCCNPTHISLGTHGDNMRDASAKGRLPGGVITAEIRRSAAGKPRPRGQKLTPEQVQFIREQVANGPRGTSTEMARLFAITTARVSQLVNSDARQYDAPLRPRLIRKAS